jgi:hypothetical protein
MDEYGRLLVKSMQSVMWVLDWAPPSPLPEKSYFERRDEAAAGVSVDAGAALQPVANSAQSFSENSQIQTSPRGVTRPGNLNWVECSITFETVPPNGWRMSLLRRGPNSLPLSCSLSSLTKAELVKLQPNEDKQPFPIHCYSPDGSLEVKESRAILVIHTPAGKISLVDSHCEARVLEDWAKTLNDIATSNGKIQWLHSGGFKHVSTLSMEKKDHVKINLVVRKDTGVPPSAAAAAALVSSPSSGSFASPPVGNSSMSNIPTGNSAFEGSVTGCSIVMRFTNRELLCGVKSPAGIGTRRKWRLTLSQPTVLSREPVPATGAANNNSMTGSPGGSPRGTPLGKVTSFSILAVELPAKSTIAKSSSTVHLSPNRCVLTVTAFKPQDVTTTVSIVDSFYAALCRCSAESEAHIRDATGGGDLFVSTGPSGFFSPPDDGELDDDDDGSPRASSPRMAIPDPEPIAFNLASQSTFSSRAPPQPPLLKMLEETETFTRQTLIQLGLEGQLAIHRMRLQWLQSEQLSRKLANRDGESHLTQYDKFKARVKILLPQRKPREVASLMLAQYRLHHETESLQ